MGKNFGIGLIKRNTPKKIFFISIKPHIEKNIIFWREKTKELGLTEILFYKEEKFLLEGHHL
ncbi:MAG: hypothetical protein C0169_05280 [Thermodesulfobacterium geofontis]|uniref:Uncharacterized protein n=1 Tax=Thermodesulfobacterium geofontis TaxID=1295609 RepID=A0A2N7QB29_9BACT|nr:MAG: hypothetical protein C0169_05280 [Thermodesulfobacterium geofontis]